MQPSKFFLIVLFMICVSCSSSNDPLDINRWELTSVFSYMTNSELPVSELDYTETVEFVEDGLFLKARTTEGETAIFEGSWEESQLDGQQGFLVQYLESNPLIENCSRTLVEFYFIQEGLLIQNNATPCDGPEYRYARNID